MVDLAVYAVGGGLEDKSKRTVALMWEDARHQVAGVFFVAMATASLLAWENFSGKSDVSIRPVTDVLFLYAFIFISSLAIQTPLVDFFAKKIRWWLGAASLMFMSSSLFMLYLFDLGFVARLALTAAPFLLALLALLRWLADDQRRSDLFDLANRCCDFACWWSIIAAIFVWMRPVHLLEIFQQLTEYKPESGMWETFWPLLPFVIASNLGIAFMRKEKIRNGFLHSHPHLMKKESLLPKGFRRQQARACKPLLGSARYILATSPASDVAGRAPLVRRLAVLAGDGVFSVRVSKLLPLLIQAGC